MGDTFKISKQQMLAMSKDPIVKCPLNWIELEYLYNDDEPVSGAKYTVKDADGGFSVSGTLDERGRAHVELPTGLSQVSFSFHDDPGPLLIKIQPKPHGQAAEPGWLERVGNSLADLGMWIWGVVQGDFNEDPSLGQILANTIITAIPVVDQVGDIRDLVANLKRIVWDEKYDDYASWVAMTLTLLGLVPTVGSLVKGVCKAIWLGAREVKWNNVGKAVGENGETQITVKLKQNGKLHGFPSGPKSP